MQRLPESLRDSSPTAHRSRVSSIDGTLRVTCLGGDRAVKNSSKKDLTGGVGEGRHTESAVGSRFSRLPPA
jgi:hypothetical protein